MPVITESVKLATPRTELEKLAAGDDRVERPATPIARHRQIHRSDKRNLRISPSTPVGLPRKLLFLEFRQNIKHITMEEDTDMFDWENSASQTQGETQGEQGSMPHSVNLEQSKTYGPRRVLKGLRRDGVDVKVSSQGQNTGGDSRSSCFMT